MKWGIRKQLAEAFRKVGSAVKQVGKDVGTAGKKVGKQVMSSMASAAKIAGKEFVEKGKRAVNEIKPVMASAVKTVGKEVVKIGKNAVKNSAMGILRKSYKFLYDKEEKLSNRISDLDNRMPYSNSTSIGRELNQKSKERKQLHKEWDKRERVRKGMRYIEGVWKKL